MKSLQLDYSDYPKCVGRRLRIQRGDKPYEGKMIGVDWNAYVMTGPATSVAPWILRLDDGTTRHFIPGPWKVCDPAAGQWFVDC